MLPLDDQRWKQLSTFFGEPESFPPAIQVWLESIGSAQEVTVYCDLCDIFLHQATITNAAFAAVPWLVHVCKQGITKFQVEYLTDVALVEANRLKYGVYYNREGTEAYPEWLMADYGRALEEARKLVDVIIEKEPDEGRKRGLVAMRPALFGDADLAWEQW